MKETNERLKYFMMGLQAGVKNAKHFEETSTLTEVADKQEADDRIYNLSLYLDYVRQKSPELWDAMMQKFSGMPGWTHTTATYEQPEGNCDNTYSFLKSNFFYS